MSRLLRVALIALVAMLTAASSRGELYPASGLGGTKFTLDTQYVDEKFEIYFGDVPVAIPGTELDFCGSSCGFFYQARGLTPFLPAGIYDVKVTSLSGEEEVFENAYTSLAGPIDIFPRLVSTDGWSPVRLYVFGRTSVPDARIYFGGVEATDVRYVPDPLQPHYVCAAPPHEAGVVDVVLDDGVGEPIAGGVIFTYGEPLQPELSDDVYLSYAHYGGFGFSGWHIIEEGLQAYLNGIPLTLTYFETDIFGGDTIVAGEAPRLCPMVTELLVVNAGGGSDSAVVRVEPKAPEITSITPQYAAAGQEVEFLISGANLFPIEELAAHFEDKPAEVVSMNGWRAVSVISPAGLIGAVSVEVTNSLGLRAVLQDAAIFEGGPNAPMISHCEPAIVSKRGEAFVRVYAEGLSQRGKIRVLFGRKDATNVQVYSDYLTCTAPRGEDVDVVVINPDGSADVLQNAVERTFEEPEIGVVPRELSTSGGRLYIYHPLATQAHSAVIGDMVVDGYFVNGPPDYFSTFTTSGHAPGTVDVTLNLWSGETIEFPDAVTFIHMGHPELKMLWPPTGSTSSWTHAVISLEQSRDLPIRIFIGENEIRRDDSDGVAPWRIPPGPPGPVDVLLVEASGLGALYRDAFKYVDDTQLEDCVITGALGPEGDVEGEFVPFHSADVNASSNIELGELLRVIQLFNSGEFHCDAAGEDGFSAGAGAQGCAPHHADYGPQNWQFDLPEILRVIQLYNTQAGFVRCPGGMTEDGFCLEE